MGSNVQALAQGANGSPSGERRAEQAPISGVSAKSGRSVALDAAQAGNALAIVCAISPERKAELALLLTRFGTNIDTTTDMVFDELQSVHFMRWVVIEAAAPGQPALLAFESLSLIHI